MELPEINFDRAKCFNASAESEKNGVQLGDRKALPRRHVLLDYGYCWPFRLAGILSRDLRASVSLRFLPLGSRKSSPIATRAKPILIMASRDAARLLLSRVRGPAGPMLRSPPGGCCWHGQTRFPFQPDGLIRNPLHAERRRLVLRSVGSQSLSMSSCSATKPESVSLFVNGLFPLFGCVFGL